MSLFPRFTHEFSPLFRLLDDYDRASHSARSFAPKFDVREAKDAFELYGELPGINQKDIAIEWTEGNTLTISGRTEQHHESGEQSSDSTVLSGVVQEKSTDAHQPTVEDESTAATKHAQSGEVAMKDADAPKYWISERSVGEFHRSFSFPARVDQDAVKASLKNGILSVVVPKAAAPKPRRINIE